MQRSYKYLAMERLQDACLGALQSVNAEVEQYTQQRLDAINGSCYDMKKEWELRGISTAMEYIIQQIFR